jgi:hypothetical protein
VRRGAAPLAKLQKQVNFLTVRPVGWHNDDAKEVALL